MLRFAGILIAALLALAPAARAAPFHVDTDADQPAGNAADCTDASAMTPCGIRDALSAAAANPGDDEVVVPPGTYVIAGGSFLVEGAPDRVTITGAGAAQTTLDGDHGIGVLTLDADTTIAGVTIRNGRDALSGGGILANQGTLLLRDSVVEANDAGVGAGPGEGGGIAIRAAGPSRIERSVVRGNLSSSSGGGIFTAAGAGALTIVDSTLAANRIEGPSGAGGAAIFARGDLTLTRVAVTDNTATATSAGNDTANGAGAVALAGLVVSDSTFARNSAIGQHGNQARGGALYLSGTTQEIRGTTFAGNLAQGGASGIEGGAIRQFSGTLRIVNSTFTANRAIGDVGASLARGGAATIDTPATLTNVTLAGNTASGSGTVSGGNLVAPNTTLRNTIVAAGSPQNCALGIGAAVNSIDSGTSCGFASGSNLDPRLGPLASNGGLTQTFGLLAGSPAIDRGTAAGAPATDQRGVARPQGAAVDIGAFELVPPPRPPVGGAAPDRTAPAFQRLRVVRAGRRMSVRYSLSEAAVVAFAIERRTTGRRVKGRCVKRTNRNRARRHCVRYVRLTGGVTKAATAGSNRLKLRRLGPGRYRLRAAAVDQTGNRSRTARVTFRVR